MHKIRADRMGQFASGYRLVPISIARILTSASSTKRQANMGSKTSKAEPKVAQRPFPLATFSADIERRRAETGVTELPRNSGKRRTASKRALLKAIKEAGGDW